ncbi:iron-sulfur cluster repair protein YtfE [uncultured Microbulbifer sp.]|uniref:iron-sulfur cluster repair protein YtfE n=1 Tax=uncultured Microbulbifer sp. TaxID=348147 RepID=UPI0025E3C3C1|nr:iron-sulfur cluster repair protein YtfE [uncultured Microbulbifer sp.]
MDLLDIPIATLARELPGAAALFDRYDLQYCCDGNKTLQDVFAEHPLDREQLLDELHTLIAQPVVKSEQDWREASDSELVEHLLQRYHQVHRRQLADLIHLAQKVENTHGDHPACPQGLADHLRTMAAELEQHMQKEEMILFPMLCRGQGDMAGGPIRVMLGEHDDHAAAIEQIDALTGGITLPDSACNSWRGLYTGLQAFTRDLQKHIQLENDILFARHLAA